MNLLAQLLRGAPTVVDSLVEGREDEVPFEQVVRALEQGEPPRSLYADAARRAAEDPVVGSYIAESFLGALAIEVWERRLAEARPSRSGLPSEWVTFVRGEYSGRGVTLPEDPAPDGRLSFFTRVQDSVRRISIERPGAPDVSASLALEGRCRTAWNGTCEPGSCDCVAYKVVAPDATYCDCAQTTAA
jgi:hypothetical protein